MTALGIWLLSMGAMIVFAFVWRPLLVAPIVMQMFLIAEFAKVPLVVGPLHSNIGNVFYAVAVFGFSIIVHLDGHKGAMRTIYAVFAILVAHSLIAQATLTLPVGDIQYMTALRRVFRVEQHVLVASFIAFYAGNVANVGIFQSKIKPLWLKKLTASIATQAVDSPIFFALAFARGAPGHDVIVMMLSGFIFKCALHIIDTPIFVTLCAAQSDLSTITNKGGEPCTNGS